MDNPLVEIRHLSKKYRDVQAVDDLSLTVCKKDIYGFLGPNGSGKSTTIRMLLSLVAPDAGNIRVFGRPFAKHRNYILSRTGALIEKPDFYEYLSARKNLELLSMYSGIKPDRNKIGKVLELTGLLERSHSKVKTFSKGMKQRLGIAQALLHEPELLVLDEPASGLDPSGMRDIRNLVRYLNKEKGITIILSSHNLLEIEMIANRMVIINKGKKVIEGSVRDMLMEHSYYNRFVVNNGPRALELIKSSSLETEEIDAEQDVLRIFCRREVVPEINKLLVENNIRVESIRTEHNLEDYFLTLT